MTYVEVTPTNVEPIVRKQYEQLLSEMKTVERYECPLCHQLERNEYSITSHLLGHAIDDRIAELWAKGKTLGDIASLYHMFQGIIPDRPESDNSFLECHHDITKEMCFKISSLQCCDYPAYRITNITHSGKITVWGDGGWSGGYGGVVSLRNLRDPRPSSELYIHSKR
ncbi:MAG: hypothetical protein V3U84_00855 [Thiotrichaceae bacterium]